MHRSGEGLQKVMRQGEEVLGCGNTTDSNNTMPVMKAVVLGFSTTLWDEPVYISSFFLYLVQIGGPGEGLVVYDRTHLVTVESSNLPNIQKVSNVSYAV